jgi:hypothetical protein
LSHSIFGLEIVLLDGSGFICDLLNETDKSYKILYKEREYIIPKADTRLVDYNKKGKHSSFRYSTIVLKDGSKIYGVIAEDTNNSLTVKTELGFLTFEKSKIAEFPEKTSNVEMSSAYSANNVKLPETRVGIFGSSYANSSSLNEFNSISSGGGFYIEPAFLVWKSIRFGYRGEYLSSLGKSSFLNPSNSIHFFSNYGYIQYSKLFFDRAWLDFHFSVGLGASNVSYRRGSETFAGTNPCYRAKVNLFQDGHLALKTENIANAVTLTLSCAFKYGPDLK